jgi:hypothetical protein
MGRQEPAQGIVRKSNSQKVASRKGRSFFERDG